MAILLFVFAVVVGAAILDRNNRIANHTDEAVGASIHTEIAVAGAPPEFADFAAADAALKTGKTPTLTALRDVATVFSFGAKDTRTDTAYGGFNRVHDTINWIQANPGDKPVTYAAGPKRTFYLDKVVLETLPGTYVLTSDKTKTLNVFWQEYYKEAMNKAKVMIFLITEGWLMRKNCWEELVWATTVRVGKHNRMFLLDQFARDAYTGTEKANQMFPGLEGSTNGLTEPGFDKTLKELFLQIGGAADVQGTTAGHTLMNTLIGADKPKAAAALGKYVLDEDGRVTGIEKSLQLGQLKEVHP